MTLGTQEATDGDLDNEDVATYWQALNDGLTDAHRELDKLIVTIASGALGVSLILIREIVPVLKELWLLGAAWISLGIAILATLISLIASSVAHEADLKDLRAARTLPSIGTDSLSTRITRYCARGATAPLILGIGFLIAFALTNIE